MSLRKRIKSNLKVPAVLAVTLCLSILSLIELTTNNTTALEFQTDTSGDNAVKLDFTFGETLTITAGDTISIANLNPGAAAISSNEYAVVVDTNGVAGYTLTATVGCASGSNCNNTKALKSGDNSFSMVSSTTGVALSSGEWGYTTANPASASASVFKTLALYTDETPTTLNKTKDASGTADTGYTGTNSTIFQIGAYATNSQEAGTYTNVINFLAVANPIPTYTVTLATSNADSIEIDGISYINGDTPTLVQGTHTISGTLPTGYAFVGWDSIGGISIANDSSLSTTITVTGAGTLTLTGVKPCVNTLNGGYIQDVCSADTFADGASGTLTDARDGNTYTVKKINGQLWMTQNLRYLGDTGSATGTMTIGNNNSNATNTSITLYSLDSSNAGNFGAYTDHCDSTNGYNYACVYDSGSTSTGVWYNYYAATAGTISTDSNSTAASQDICPANWHLPSGPNTTANTDFNKLVGNTTSGYQDPTTGLTAFGAVAGGLYNYGSLTNTGYGYWWSATASNATSRYLLGYSSSSGRFRGNNDYNRYFGLFVRCVRSE